MARKRIPRWFTHAHGAAAIGGVSALLLCLWILLGKVESDRAAIAAACGVAAFALLFFAFTPVDSFARLLPYIKSVNIGSVAVEMNRYEDLANTGRTDALEEGATHADSLIDLRATLESRLIDLAEKYFGEPINIGSLRVDDLLDAEQARTAYEIMDMRLTELKALSAADRDTFLDGASTFVDTFRVQVLANDVSQKVRKSGWDVRRPDDGTSKRDLIARRRISGNLVEFYIVPLYAQKLDSALVAKVTKRLNADTSSASSFNRQYIVVPPNSASRNMDVDPKVVTPSDLVNELNEAAQQSHS